MKIATTAALCTLLAACAAPQVQTWYKAGATEADFNVAIARCRMGAAGMPERNLPYRPISAGDITTQAGMDLGNAASRMQYENDCLTAQGFHR